jgi:transcriptional regulator with XRE-family HTH domain
MENIVGTIEELIKRSGKTANAVLTKCELSHNSLIAWKNGKAKPSLDAVVKLADYFNVTVDFIVGREKREFPTEKEILYKNMTEEEIKLINAYRRLSTLAKITTKVTMSASLSKILKNGDSDLLTKDEMKLLRDTKD